MVQTWWSLVSGRSSAGIVVKARKSLRVRTRPEEGSILGSGPPTKTLVKRKGPVKGVKDTCLPGRPLAIFVITGHFRFWKNLHKY